MSDAAGNDSGRKFCGKKILAYFTVRKTRHGVRRRAGNPNDVTLQ